MRSWIAIVLLLFALPASRSIAQQQPRDEGRKAFSIHGGLADASGGWGIGFGGGLGYSIALRNPQLSVRIVGEFFHFQDSERGFGSISASASDNVMGVSGLADYAFKTSSPSLVPYLVGGLGLYYQKVSASIDIPGYGSGSGEDSETSLALGFGGGLRFGGRFFAELRIVPLFSGGTLIPIVAGVRL